MADSINGMGIGNPLKAAAGSFSLSNSEKSAENTLKQLKAAEGGVSSSTGATSSEKQATKAATQFEALLLHQMLGEMWKTVPKGGLFGGSNEESLYRDMLNQALAESISENKSIGVRDVVLKELKAHEKK